MEYVVKLGRTVDQTVDVTVDAVDHVAAELAALEIAEQTILDWEFVEQTDDTWCVDTTPVEEDYRKAAADLVLKGIPYDPNAAIADNSTMGSAVNLPMSTIDSWEMSGYMLPPGWQIRQSALQLLKNVEDNANQKLREEFNKAADEATDRFLGHYRVNYEQAKAILETIGEECNDPNCWCKQPDEG